MLKRPFLALGLFDTPPFRLRQCYVFSDTLRGSFASRRGVGVGLYLSFKEPDFQELYEQY